MTFTQLEYILAVDQFRHFAKAASNCYVTQPTLSMQIQKLEEELGIIVFDRSKQPVVPTAAGLDILCHARELIAKRDILLQSIQDTKGEVSGVLRVGIIPTLAPYLLPLFIKSFSLKYPRVRLVIHELMTDLIISGLRESKLDAGILVTPLQENRITEIVLFYEELLVYVSKNNSAFKKNYIMPQDIDPNRLWLLEEGHCFRSQIVNLCELRKKSRDEGNFDYEAGSIETLRKMVETNEGITILPELATLDLSKRQQTFLRYFKKPAPMREVSLVVHRNYVKKNMIEALREEILLAVPDKLRKNKTANIIPV